MAEKTSLDLILVTLELGDITLGRKLQIYLSFLRKPRLHVRIREKETCRILHIALESKNKTCMSVCLEEQIRDQVV